MEHCNWRSLCGYLDGELTLPARRQLEAHLRDCSRCRDELVILRKVDTALVQWGQRREHVPPSTERRIIESVNRPQRLPRLFDLGKMMPAAVGSSAAALLVLISVNFGWQYQNPSRIVSPTASKSQVTQTLTQHQGKGPRARARENFRAKLGQMMHID